MKRALLPVFSCLIAVAAHPGATAELTPDQKLVELIEAASILPVGYQVSVKTDGKKAIVSALRAPSATRSDYKVDAAMIARTLLVDQSSGLSRVKVQFHEPAGTSKTYQQVGVSFAEVKAFTSGVVTKDQFLDSLEVETQPEPDKTASTATAPAKQDTPRTADDDGKDD